MRYIGSKTASLPILQKTLARLAPGATSICDPFAGTCSVSSFMKRQGYSVSTGDVLAASFAIQQASLAVNRHPAFRELLKSKALKLSDKPAHARVIDHLNAMRGTHGFISEEYSLAGSAGRLFFTQENANKIDAIRQQIKRWSVDCLITEYEAAFLTAALITSADVVANTAGTYYAHLKGLTRKASKPLALKSVPIFSNNQKNSCRRGNAIDTVSACYADILYLDPPYNERDYERYYHLPETIALGDEPEVIGKSGVPRYRRGEPSDFCIQSRANDAFKRLISKSSAKYYLVHYTPEGLISHETIMTTLRHIGSTKYRDVQVRKYSTESASSSSGAWHRIYTCTRH